MEPTKWLPVLLLLLPSFGSAFKKRVIGGQECDETSHPWLVMIVSPKGFLCSAVLLNHEWLLSAAHCFESGEFRLRLGTHSHRVRKGHEQRRTSASLICYPNTNTSTNISDCSFDNDIMLIKLNEPVTYNEYISPISLPTSPVSLGTKCTVMGWGTTTSPQFTYPDVPQCADIQIFPSSTCEDAYPWWTMTDSIICAGVLEGGRDSCKGDSGGPLLCGGEFQGIISWGGFPCAQPNEPTIHTEVYNYLDWIQSIIQ
uniref:Kallikrein-Cwar1 n=1 Tax=Caribicus warreni TaxID=865857 RepID=E2E4I0_CARWR|nr:kallikrein-Cwar1 [Caribicus warreni]